MKILMVLLLFMLVSCERAPRQSATVQGQSDLLKYEDKENGVMCYRVAYTDGTSCVKVK